MDRVYRLTLKNKEEMPQEKERTFPEEGAAQAACKVCVVVTGANQGIQRNEGGQDQAWGRVSSAKEDGFRRLQRTPAHSLSPGARDLPGTLSSQGPAWLSGPT